MKAEGARLPLIALFDAAENDPTHQWRCYSPSSLNANRTAYNKEIERKKENKK
jgi:hypothetical protein